MSVEKRIDKKSGKVSWVARIYMGRKENGKPHYVSESFEKKPDALDYHVNYSNLKRNSLSRIVSDKVITDVVWQLYKAKLSEKKKDNTVLNYESRYQKWIKPHLGARPIGKINLLTITNFKYVLEDEGASPNLINYCLIVLNGFLEFASSGLQRYLIENPMKHYEMPAVNLMPIVEKVEYLNKEQATQFYVQARNDSYYLLLVFMVNTGIRISEAAALTSSDFNFDAGLVVINNNLTRYSPKRNEPDLGRGVRVLASTKGNERRAIALSPMAIKVAKEAIAASQGNHFVFRGVVHKKETVVIKRGSKPTTVQASFINSKTISSHIKKVADLAQVPDVGAHGLRHTFSANFLMNGGTLNALSKVLGHKNTITTEIYAHLSPEYLKITTSIVNFS